MRLLTSGSETAPNGSQLAMLSGDAERKFLGKQDSEAKET